MINQWLWLLNVQAELEDEMKVCLIFVTFCETVSWELNEFSLVTDVSSVLDQKQNSALSWNWKWIESGLRHLAEDTKYATKGRTGFPAENKTESECVSALCRSVNNI